LGKFFSEIRTKHCNSNDYSNGGKFHPETDPEVPQEEERLSLLFL
jgi:hypothetical protein